MQFKVHSPVFLTILLLITSQISAQTRISGTVRDAKTNEAIVGQNVIIKELQKGTITDNEGKYAITVPFGKYTVVFKSINYQTTEKKLICNDESILLNALLEQSVKQIHEVKVTAKSEARQVREQAIPVSVISVDKVQGSVSNVSELLNKTAGVKIRSTGGVGSASRISVRGLEGKRVGFFVDETPLSEQSDHIGFNEVPLDIIDRIEIYKGIVPAKFGGSAIGGAVNIVLKEYPPKYIDFSYGMQTYNTHNANILFKRNNQKTGIEYGIAGFYTYADNNYTFKAPNNPELKIKRDHDSYDKKLLGGVFTAKKWWFDEVSFDFALISTKKEIQGITHNIQEAENNSNAFFIANETEKDNFLLEGLDLDFKTSYAYTIYKFRDKAMQRYNWDKTTYIPVTEFGGEIGNDANDAYNQKHTILQKTNLNYILNEFSSLNLNTVYSYAYGIPEDTLKDKSLGYKTNYNSRMNSFIAGLNYEINLFGKKLTNSATIKYYYYDINTTLVEMFSKDVKAHDYHKNDFGFSNALRYRFTPEFLVKASYGYDVRLPSEHELLGDGFMTMPAGDLEPERNSSFNFGFMYDHTHGKNNRFQFEMNFFYMKLENMIRYVGGFLQSNYENFGEMRTIGGDIDVKYDLTSFLYIYGNATYQDLRDTRKYEAGSTTKKNPFEGDRMPNIPWLFSNVGFELHKKNLFGGKEQQSKFYFENSFVEEYFYDFEQTELEKRRIPRSSIFNLGLEHSFRHKNIMIGLQVNNIFDSEQITIFNRPMPGRTGGIRLRYIIK